MTLAGAGNISALPVLYSFRRCPYAMRARLALAVSGQMVELREVVLRAKPAALLEASPKGSVPVLVLPDGQVIDESLDIMCWTLARRDPAGWLSPEQGSAAAMHALIAECDSDFKFHLDRSKYPDRFPGTVAAEHRSAAAGFLARLEAQLIAPYLFGTRPALADMAIVPFVRQFAQVDPAWFAAQGWSNLQAWLERILESTLFAQIMHKTPAWVAGEPGLRFPPLAAAP